MQDRSGWSQTAPLRGTIIITITDHDQGAEPGSGTTPNTGILELWTSSLASTILLIAGLTHTQDRGEEEEEVTTSLSAPPHLTTTSLLTMTFTSEVTVLPVETLTP